MNYFARFSFIFAILTMFSSTLVFAQATGDYGSLGTGNWGTTGANWLVCVTPGTWGDATAAPGAPTSTVNVWIRSGHTVTVEVSAKTANNVTVESGAFLVGANLLPGSPRYVRVYGTTLTNNGSIGTSTDLLGVALYGGASQILTITGSGTTHISRIQPQISGQAVVFDANVQLNYAGGGGTGSTALYCANGDLTVTINAGKTVTMARFAYISAHNSSGSSAGNANFTINVYGSLVTGNIAHINLNNTAGKTSALTVYSGGSVTLGDSANLRADVTGPTYNITVNNGGSLTAGNTSMVSGGFATTSVDGTVDFGGSITSTRSIGTAIVGSTGTLRFKDGTYPTGAITLNSGSTVEYYGTSGITLGVSPSSYSNLKITNSSGVTLGGNATVDGTLTLLGGNVTCGANTLAIGASGSVARTTGHVVGVLQKNVAAGAGVARTFEIGDASNYTPVDVNFATVSTPGDLLASTTVLDHGSLAGSGIDPAKSVNRYWTLNNSGVGFSTYDAVFNFVPADIDGGANTSNFIGEKYNGSWSGLTEGTRTSTSTQILGAGSFSDFALGEAAVVLAPAFEFSASNLNFGGVNVGSSKIDSIYVRNIGTATLNVSTILSDNSPVFTVVPASATVPVGDSVKITVTFSPSASGAASGNVVFTHDAVSSPDTLTVSGNGIPITPTFAVNPASLNFGSVIVGNSKIDSVFVKNVGGGTLGVSLAASDNAVFTVVPGTASIAAGDSAKFTVTFLPSSIGAAGGNIVFTHDATGSPDTVAVTGTGLSAAITILSNGTGGGKWDSTASWQGGTVPTNIDSVVILGTDSVYVLSNAVCAGLNVLPGARLTLSAKLSPTNVVLGGLARVFADTLRPSGTTTVQSTGTYEHALNGGRIPTATWNSGSTIIVSGAVAISPASGNQNFHHVIWNSAAQTASLNMGWDSITIGGNITVLSTGSGRWQMCAPLAGDSSLVIIMGDVTQSAGQFTTNGTSNANTVIRIHHYGSIGVTGGNFALSRGSQGGSPISQTVWYMHNGDLVMSNATTQNSNTVGYARFLFMKSGTQNLTLSNVTFAGGGLPTEVASGTTLNAGTSITRGSGAFTVNSGAVLECGNTGGLDSTLAGGGTHTLSAGAGYTFNATSAQVTGIKLPPIVSELTINNANGVGLSDSVFVTDTLHLTSGVLHEGALTLQMGPFGVANRTSGHVNGKLNKVLVVLGGAGSQTYEIGDSTNYTPVLIAGTSYGSGFEVVASSTPGEHPSVGGSIIDPTKSVNRYYTLIGSPTGPSDITFNFIAGDVDGGANTANFTAAKYDSPTWTTLTPGTRTATSTQVTGVADFSEFAIGEAVAIIPDVTWGANMKVQMQAGLFRPDLGDAVLVRGAFNGFGTADTLVDGDNDSIYTKTVALTPSSSGGYKFFKTLRGGSDWESGSDRGYSVGVNDTSYTRYFNDHDVAATVTFQVDMRAKSLEASFIPGTDAVTVRGAFNDWGNSTNNPDTLDDGDVDSVYTLARLIATSATSTMDYKFWAGGSLGYESISNRQVMTPGDTVLPVVCFDNDCVANIPGFLVSPSAIAFGSVVVGDTLRDTVYAYNTGLATLNVSSIASDNALFAVTPSSGSIAQGDSLAVVVSFAPDSVQAETGNIIFTHDALSSTDTLTVNGIGYNLPPAYFLSLSPDSVFNEDPLKPNKSKKIAKRNKGLYPNWSNLIDEVNAQGGFAPGTSESDSAGGMLIGKSYMFNAGGPGPAAKWKAHKDSAKIHPWVRLGKWDFKKNIGKSFTNIQKTLNDKGLKHTGSASGIDTTTDGKNKPIYKQLTKLSPKKHSNKLFAELIALKVNIAASAMGKTPSGLGDLVFDTDGNFLDEMTILQIADTADLMMTLWQGHTQDEYDSLYSAVYNINRAFIGALDTITFNLPDSLHPKGKMTLAGAVDVNTVPYLKVPSPFVATRTFALNSEVESPEDWGDEEDGDEEGSTPVAAKLYQNYPNPFNPSTVISFRLLETSQVTVRVYNMLGQEIATLLSGEEMDEGMQEVQFSAGGISSGVYFYRIEAQGQDDAGLKTVETRKMVLLK